MTTFSINGPLEEAEMSVLGGILFEGDKPFPNAALATVREHLTNGEEFSSPRHRMFYAAMLDLADAEKPIDLTTLSNEIQKRGGDGRGELNYLAEIMERVPTAAMVGPHAKIVKEAAIKRRARTALLEAAARVDGSNGTDELDEALSTIGQRVEEMRDAVKIADKKERRSVVLSHAELLAYDAPDKEWLIDGILPKNGRMMIYAAPGVGKTFFALCLAVCVALGKLFMKWVTKTCAVLYIDGEMSASTFRERLTGFHLPNEEPVIFTLHHTLAYERRKKDLNVIAPYWQREIFNTLDAHPEIGLVVFDNLSCLVPLKEDKSDDWRTIVQPFLAKLSNRGVAVLLVHHTGKGGDQRGSSARIDQLDTALLLKKATDGADSKGAHFIGEFTKWRHRDETNHDLYKPFSAKLVSAETGGLTWELGGVVENTETRLIALLKDFGEDGCSVMDAAKELQVSHSLISRVAQKLKKEGLVKKNKGKAPMFLMEYSK